MSVSNKTQKYSIKGTGYEDMSSKGIRPNMTDRFAFTGQRVSEDQKEYDQDYDEVYLDKETEHEVIQVLQHQNQKIADYEETIAELNLKVSQLDVYKHQVASLQNQVQVLNEKFKFTQYEASSSLVPDLEARLRQAIEVQKSMGNEINTKETEIKYLSERIEEK